MGAMTCEPKSCCLCISTRTGTLILGHVGVVTSLMGIVASILLVLYYEDDLIAMCHRDHPRANVTDCEDYAIGAMGFFVTVEVIRGIVSALLIVAVLKGISSLIIPYLMLHGLVVAFLGVGVVAGTIGFASYRSRRESISFVVFGGIIFSVAIHLYRVVQMYSKELSDQEGSVTPNTRVQLWEGQQNDPPPPYKEI